MEQIKSRPVINLTPIDSSQLAAIGSTLKRTRWLSNFRLINPGCNLCITIKISRKTIT